MSEKEITYQELELKVATLQKELENCKVRNKLLEENNDLEYRNRLEEAQKVAKLGHYILDIKTGNWICSEELDNTFGISEDEQKNYEIWLKVLHPDYKTEMTEYFQNHVLTQHKKFDKEYKIIDLNENEKWVHGLGNLKFNNKNEPIEMFGTIQDITEKKQIEIRLKNSEERYHALFEYAKDAILIIKNEKFVSCNQSALELFGYPTKDLFLGKPPWELSPEYQQDGKASKQKAIFLINEAFLGRPQQFNWIHLKQDGQPFNAEISLNAVVINGEKLVQTILRDVTEKILIEKKLKEQNEEYESLNEELRQTNRELFEAKQKAEESNRLKTAFLQNISHEFRTPMNGILGFSDLIYDEIDDKNKFYVEKIKESSYRLLDIVNDTVEISQIQSSIVRFNESEFDLLEMLKNLADFGLKKANDKSIEFIVLFDIIDSVLIIKTDKQKLFRSLKHVLDNAVKFTETGKVEFVVSIDKEQKNVFFKIEDTGIGIPKDKQAVIFEPFWQMESGTTRNYGGNGIGLSLVNTYIDMLNGQLKLKSEVGKGTIVEISIPIKKSIVEFKKTIKTKKDFRLTGKTVMIVEDELINYHFLCEIFQSFEVNVIYAKNGKIAVDLFKENSNIDFILMDLKMPVLDGYEATKQIKKINVSIPIVAQTAYVYERHSDRFKQTPFDGYISKPIRANKLLKVIEDIFT